MKELQAIKMTPPWVLLIPAARICEGAGWVAYSDFRHAVATLAGGFTETKQQGGYVMKDDHLEIEEIIRFETRLVANDEGVAKIKPLLELFRTFSQWLIDQGEEAVMFESISGTFLIIEREQLALEHQPVILDESLADADTVLQ